MKKLIYVFTAMVLFGLLLAGCRTIAGETHTTIPVKETGKLQTEQEKSDRIILPPSIEPLQQAKAYRVVDEGVLVNDDKQRTAGLWYIYSEEAERFEEYAQTAIQAVLDLYKLYGRTHTGVILVPGPEVRLTYYASASYASDGKGAAGLTGSAPAVPMYWKVRAMDDLRYSEQELAVITLRQDKMADFPSRDSFSSLGYDEPGLRQYIADTLHIPYEETKPRSLKMAEYRMDGLAGAPVTAGPSFTAN